MEAHGLRERATRPVRVESRWVAGARRLVDLLLAGALLIVLAPAMIAIAVAIRLDSAGPALFRQRRVGLGGREFTVFKFRSMRADADPGRHREYVSALIQGTNAEPGSGDLYKLTVDDRITPVGRWIRGWSLDELPQLLNVVAGQMSLVGPRPAIPYEVEEYPRWYMRRFDVKPGLTGLWQVNGRNERTYEEMVRLDVEYVETRTLRLDLGIVARTPLTVLRRKGVS
jgi:lipopolysaccharide/colanic/teichoic acid biosynthesis glycosyltransferase